MASFKAHETCQAIFVRFLFLCHGTLSFVTFFSNSPEPQYWLITIPLVLLVFDIALRYDCNYVWLSAILYISSLLPIIWCVELELLESRIKSASSANFTDHHPATTEAHPVTEQQPTILSLSNEVVAKKLCEIGLVIGLIIGRAIAPRGAMSHDQLSSMLLGFVGNSADIIGVFDTFSHETIIHSRTVTYIVLGCFTWSIYQFTFNPYIKNSVQEKNGVIKGNKAKSMNKRDIVTESLFQRQLNTGQKTRDYGSTEMLIQKQDKTRKKKQICNIEVVSNLVLLLMHDGPFFILRAVLIFSYNVMSEIHVFFTIKNAMVVVLLVYRLCSLCCCGEEDEDEIRDKDEQGEV